MYGAPEIIHAALFGGGGGGGSVIYLYKFGA